MKNKLVLDKLTSVTSGVDLVQVPPIQQKRLLTFVNHFIITTVGFLNNFVQTCESKLLACDYKMQKIEAQLCILEAKLNSIPGLEVGEIIKKVEVTPNVPPEETVKSESALPSDLAPSVADEPQGEIQSPESESNTPSAAKNPELTKFFKMVQFGVPVPAVKLKMQQEGFDPNLLDS